MAKKTKGLALLIDGNNALCRGAFAVSPLHTSDGFPTYAIKGFCSIFLSAMYKLHPTHVVVAFDAAGGSAWRKKLYPEYKGTRNKGKELPQPLVDAYKQISPLKELLYALGVRTSTAKGHEADDVLGTLTRRFADAGMDVVIHSNDKDFAQLVDPMIGIMSSESSNVLDADGIYDKYGVRPEQIIDYLALLGDKSDNIPGVNKCGAVTAAKLLSEYKTLKTVIKNTDKLTPALKTNVEAARQTFDLAKTLLTIRTDLKLKTTTESARFPTENSDRKELRRICKELELKATHDQLTKLLGGLRT